MMTIFWLYLLPLIICIITGFMAPLIDKYATWERSTNEGCSQIVFGLAFVPLVNWIGVIMFLYVLAYEFSDYMMHLVKNRL